MSSANDEKPARNEDAKGAVATQTASDETTSELELLDATPTPMVLPTGAPPPPPLHRPPPVPGLGAPPPPPPRTTQSRPAVPPPPPSTVEDPTPAPAAPPAAPAGAPPSARRTSATLPVPSAARHSPPELPAAPLPTAGPARPNAALSVPIGPLPGAGLGPHTVPLPTASYTSQPAEAEPFAAEAAIADARKRVEQAASGERSALARRHTELGLLLEIAAGDGANALAEYRAAHGVAAHQLAPISSARRLTPLRPAAPAIALLEAEVQVTQDPAAKLTRLLELGMLLATSGAPAERAAQAYREVLATQPGHVGALRGLESALAPSPRNPESAQQTEARAAHLATMAAAFRHDPRLSAWLEVERGQLLERLGRHDAARAAFEAAIALDGQLGPVRDAYTTHLVVQGQVEALVKAWAAEAALESEPPRAARLLYFAGRLAAERLDQKAQAVELFERAAAGEAAAPSVRRAALRELFRLYEAMGTLERAAAVGMEILAEAREGERGYWHRRMVPVCETLERHADMAAHAQQVLSAEPDDEAMRDKLDRALDALGKHADRVAMLTEQAANASTGAARIELLMRAARIAERDMGRVDLALFSLRSAWAVEPSHPDVTDAIVRLLTPGTPPTLTDPDDPSRVRARVDFYVEAAAAATDHARKVAHLEKLALIWEDEVRAPERALAVYGEILSVEPRRRSAILGLARCAARAGNARALLRALMLEADQAGDDPSLERSLLLRAAEVASEKLDEVDTALELIKRVLARAGGDPAALRAAFHVHDRAGRSADALAQLRLLQGQSKQGAPAYAVQAEIARYLEERMHRTADALTAWREAHRLAPANPAPRAEIRRILLANGDWRAVADELAALANAATQPVDRGELLLEAAEIYDDRLNDAERAMPLLVDARSCLPDDVAIVDRLDRAYLRSHKRAERLTLLHATETPDPRCQLALATLQAEERDPGKALDRVVELAGNPTVAAPALRMLEHALRRAERWNELALVLRRQIDCLASAEARLSSVFELVALEEYGELRPPDGQPAARELLARLAPDDLLRHELFIRRSGLALAAAVPHRQRADALGALAAAVSDGATAAALQLAAALLLEHGSSPSHQDQKEALVAYAIALEAWPDCVTAARGTRRMALRLGETETFVNAAVALGSLELEPSARCERLLEAADAGGAHGTAHDQRAFELVCKALGEDPGSGRATDALIGAITQGLDAGKTSDALRAALDHVVAPDQAAKLGATLAHVALAHLDDPTVALEALRRTRKRAPKHVANLLALAEVSNALGLHAEAVEAASSALAITREPADRLRATITLAEVHVRTPAFRDTARREATEAEKLFEQVGGGSGELIGRLGGVFRQLGEEASAERVLIAALTLGDSGTALDNLVTMYGSGQEAGERVATALHKVMSQAEVAGRPKRAEWLAALGRIEATMLGRTSDGLARIREAALMSPGRLETFQALADAYGPAHDEAARELLALWPAFARTAPPPTHIAAMVSLLARTARASDRPSIGQVADQLLDFLRQPTAAHPETLPTRSPAAGCLGRATVVSALLHDVMQAPLLDVASLLRDTVDKLIARSPEDIGLSARDRLTARTSHPVRALADRVARAFGDLRFDVYLAGGAPDLGRLVPSDPPVLVLPAELALLPELAQIGIVARLLAYLALDIPWLEELPVADTDGILFGGLRVGAELWGKGELSPTAELAATSWRPRLAKASSRKVRRNLEDGTQRVRAPVDSSAWREAMRIAALRSAFVLTGDLPTVLSQAMTLAGDFGGAHGPVLTSKLFAQPLTREVVVFALSDHGSALRRAAGTL